MNIIFKIIYYTVLLGLLGPAVNYIYTTKRKKAIKQLALIILGLLTISSIPMLLIDGQRKNILSFALEGNIWFTLILVSYAASLISLLFERKIKIYPALLFYSVAYFSTWIALAKYIPDSVINNEKNIGILWLIIFILIPTAVYLLFLGVTLSYKKKADVILSPETAIEPSLIRDFKVNIHPGAYMLWGGMTIIGGFYIFVVLLNQTELTLASSVLLLIGSGAFFTGISYIINNTISLSDEDLFVPITGGIKALLFQKTKFRVADIHSVILAKGAFLYGISKKIGDPNLKKNLDSYRAGGFQASLHIPFLYIRNKDASSYLFGVVFYPEKKLIELAEQLSLRNIQTEIHL